MRKNETPVVRVHGSAIIVDCAPLAQWLEQRPFKSWVVGSSPTGGTQTGRNHCGSDVSVSWLLSIVWVTYGKLCGSRARLSSCEATAGSIPRSGSCVTAARTRITCGEENRNDRRQAHWQGEIGPDTGSSHRGPRESRSARIRGRRRGNDTEGETLQTRTDHVRGDDKVERDVERQRRHDGPHAQRHQERHPR